MAYLILPFAYCLFPSPLPPPPPPRLLPIQLVFHLGGRVY